MRSLSFLVSLALASIALPAVSATTQRDRVASFLEDHLIGKTLVHEAKGLRDRDRVTGENYEYDFARRWAFSNLTQSDRGLSFDALVSIQQTRYALQDGVRGEGKRMDRQIIVRFEAQESRATGTLFGFAYYMTSAGMALDPTGRAYTLTIGFEADELVLRYTSIPGNEWPGGTSDDWRLVSCDDEERIRLEDGKIVRYWSETCFIVDPKTMLRSGPSASPFVVKDVEG